MRNLKDEWGIENPEYNLVGFMRVWFTVRDGKIVEIELAPESIEVDAAEAVGLAFAREAGTKDDGPDLTLDEIQEVWDGTGPAELERIDSIEGFVYLDTREAS